MIPAIKPAFTISRRQVQLSARKPVRASVKEVFSRVPPHDHDYCEVCLVTQGTGWHLTQNHRHPLRRGDVLSAAPGEVHSFEAGRDLRVINLYYLSEWLLRDAREFGDQAVFPLFFARSLFRSSRPLPVVQFRLDAKAIGPCERELRDIVEEGSRTPASLPFLRAALTKFMVIAAGSCPAETRGMDAGFRPEVWMALREIEGQVAEGRPFASREMGRGVNLSSFHLARLFKRETGWTPSDYYQLRRVQKAGALLLEGRPAITDVALECGYADASHLGRNFRRFLRLTPREYRARYHGE